MKHISLDDQPQGIREFVLALPVDRDGSVLELNGAPVLHVARMSEDEPVDEASLKAALIARRDASRALNAEWDDVDRQTWELADTNSP